MPYRVKLDKKAYRGIVLIIDKKPILKSRMNMNSKGKDEDQFDPTIPIDKGEDEKGLVFLETKLDIKKQWYFFFVPILIVLVVLLWDKIPWPTEPSPQPTNVIITPEIITAEASQPLPPEETQEAVGEDTNEETPDEDIPVSDEVPPHGVSLGAKWIDPTDGMTLAYVPVGSFIIGAHPENTYSVPSEEPEISVSMSAYWIDITEVSNDQFAKFVEETGYVTTAENGKWGRVLDIVKETWYVVEGADWRHPYGPHTSIDNRMNYPVVQVSWYDTQAYCDWAGRQLPTEAQWEKAVKGNTQREFEWETSKNYRMCADANFADNSIQSLSWAKPGCDDTSKFSAPVDYSFYQDANGPCGALNLVGNINEWLLDDYDAKFYENMFPEDPVNITNSSIKSQRGGSWASSIESMRYTRRDWDAADKVYDTTGFRCVYNP